MPTLVVSSPERLADRCLKDALNEYSEDWHYMPVPTEEEVRQLRTTCFPHVKEEDMEKRLSLWGPIPRFVLVRTSPSAQRRGLAARNIGTGDDSDLDAPHPLVHERAAGQVEDAETDSTAANLQSRQYFESGAVATTRS